MGIKSTKLSADWAKQRIKGLSLAKTLISTISTKKLNKKVKTLTKEFHYPPLGPGQMWEATAKKVTRNGGRILINQPVDK